MIVNFYKADGSKERRPLGYKGSTCQTASAPYRQRDLGQGHEVPTDEAQQPVVALTEQDALKASN